MGAIYDFYERRIFPHFLDVAMKGMEDLRPAVLEGAHGDVMEIGFGTGLNLRHYPEGVGRLSTVDPMDAVREKVRRRIEGAPFPVDVHHLPADGALPFDSDRFDCVTVTWTLCTIPDPVAALVEARRVLKPGGRLFFIEHGRSDDTKVAARQDRWNPIQNVIGCGCNINRKVDALVEQAGFAMEKLDRFCLEKTPRVVGEMYRGQAVAGP